MPRTKTLLTVIILVSVGLGIAMRFPQAREILTGKKKFWGFF